LLGFIARCHTAGQHHAKFHAQRYFSPVVYLMNLSFENTNKAADTMPIEKRRIDPVLTKTIKPSTTKPKTNNPSLFLDNQQSPK
jgi:hypothetical protein